MELGLEGKVALVTAASKGLGRGVARALAEEGAKVVICARGEDALRRTESEIKADGGDVLALAIDVTEPGAPARLVQATIDQFGRLDVLVGNAGGPPPGRSLEVSEDQLQAALNANLLTSVRLVREARPHMQASGWGRICLIASFYIREPSRTLALSNTARTGLWAWAKTAAADIFGEGITLNLVCPGIHDTDRVRGLNLGPDVPKGRPEDFGKVVAFLCSEPAGFITGAAIQVDGGAIGALS